MKKHPSSFRLALCALAAGFNLVAPAVEYVASCGPGTVDTRRAPLIVTQPATWTNDAGTTATFNAVVEGTEPLAYQWWKGGSMLSDSGNISGANTSNLIVSNVLGSDAGQYSIVITNQFGSVTSQVARLTVNDPMITAQSVSQNRELGQSVTFSVTARGTAPLSYQWYKDGVMTYNGNASSLALTSLKDSAAGDYAVVVQNQYGSVTSAVATLCIPAESHLPLNQQVTGRLRTSCSVDRWHFSAVSGTQIRFDLINVSRPGAAFTLSGPGAWTGFANLTNDSNLITLPASGAYTIAALAVGGQSDIAYAFRLVETTQTSLPLGTNFVGQFAGSGQAQIFLFTVTNSGPLLIQLANAGLGNHSEIYVKLGAPPTRSDYDFRFDSPASANQRILIPEATAGTWYVLVYGDYIPTPSAYTLSVTAADVFLTGSTPKIGGTVADTLLTITGAGFRSGVTAQLVATNGTAYTASAVNLLSGQQMTAQFLAGAVPPGTYTIRVIPASGGAAKLPNVFEMVNGGLPHLTTKVIVPSVIGYAAPATIYIEYANTGTAAMPAPLLSLTATQKGLQGAFLTLDQSRANESFWTDAIPAGYKTEVAILASGATAGLLQPGESCRTPVHYAGWRTSQWDFNRPPIYFNLNNITADDTTPVDWSSLFLPQQPTGTDPAWQRTLANVQTNMGSTWGQHVLALGNLAQTLYAFSGGSVSVVDADTLEFYLLQGAGEASATQSNSPVLVTAKAADPSPGTIYSYAPGSGSWTELASDAILDPNLSTIVIIHGWNDRVDAGWEAQMASAIYSTHPAMNILAVDWRIWAKSWSKDPWSPATYIPEVARRVTWRLFGPRGALMAGEADLILGLGLRPENTHLIGHSHGAHVAGLAAEYSRYDYRNGTVKRVTALDPSNEISHFESGNGLGGGWGNNRNGGNRSASFIDSYTSSDIAGDQFRTYGDDNFFVSSAEIMGRFRLWKPA